MEPTQMPINERLDKENVAHIHHGILCNHKKWWVCILCKDMDESGNHHFQQADTRTANQTLHILTHRWVLNNTNTWTQQGEHHILRFVGGCLGEKQRRVGRLGRDNMVRNPDIDDRGIKAANHLAMYVPMQQSCMICTCTTEPKVQ